MCHKSATKKEVASWHLLICDEHAAIEANILCHAFLAIKLPEHFFSFYRVYESFIFLYYQVDIAYSFIPCVEIDIVMVSILIYVEWLHAVYIIYRSVSVCYQLDISYSFTPCVEIDVVMVSVLIFAECLKVVEIITRYDDACVQVSMTDSKLGYI